MHLLLEIRRTHPNRTKLAAILKTHPKFNQLNQTTYLYPLLNSASFPACLKVSLDSLLNCEAHNSTARHTTQLRVTTCNCKDASVFAFFASLHRGEGGDAPSARCGDTVCNITSRTWSNFIKKGKEKSNIQGKMKLNKTSDVP
jgi:hypothetical protein